jgi:hypothetical protein
MSSAVAPLSSTLPSRPSPSFLRPPWGRLFPQTLRVAARQSESVQVSGLEGLGIHVLKPFYIRVDPDDEGYIAKSSISFVYETGETWPEALRNVIFALKDHFEWLTEIEESLAPSVQEELALLREYLSSER